MAGNVGDSEPFWSNAKQDGTALQQYRTLVDAMGDGLYQLDADGRFVAVNDAVVATTGYAREELLDSHVSKVLDEADVARFEAAVRGLLATDTEDAATLDLPVRTAGGEVLPWEVRLSVVEDAGEFRGTVGVAREVTDGNERGQESGRDPDRYESLVDDVLDEAEVGVFVLDPDGDVAWINGTTERYFGLDREEVLGRDKRTLVDERIRDAVADGEAFADTVRATYDGDAGAEAFECRVVSGDGREERWLEHRSKPIETGRFAGGRVELYYDVTDQKDTEAALGEGEQRFRSLVDAVEEYAIFMLDPEGCVVSWNEGARQLKGYEADEIRGEHVSTFYTEADRADGVPGGNLDAAAETGSVEDEGWRVRADGSRFWANVTITAVRDDVGELKGFVKVTRDMTERRERERRIEAERDLTGQLLEAVHSSIILVDADGSVVRANERAQERFGFATGEEGGTDLADVDIYDEDGDWVPPSDRPYVQVFETGEPLTDWHCQTDLEAGRRWLSVNAVPIRDADGGVGQAVLTSEDVTQLTEQARRLERQRDDLQDELDEVFERIDDGFYALDDELRFTYVNDRAEELLQVDEEELLGESIWEVFPEARETPARDAFHQAMETQERTGYEVYFDLLEFWVEAAVYPSDSGLSVHFRDVTERKERERELEEYETIVETISEGVYVVDDEGRFTWVDRTYAEMVGYEPEDLVGAHVSTVVDDPTVRDARDLEARLRAGDVDTDVIETEVRTADGETFPAAATFALIPDDDGTDRRVGVVRDVTERKERESELERRVRQQEVVTELGQYALENPDLDDLFDRAAEEVADTLDNEYAKVLELLPDGEEVLLRSGVGWRDGLVGEATVDTGLESQAGYTLVSEEPVVVDDMDAEERFSGPELLTSHGVESGVSVVIGPTDDPWGVLGTHSTGAQSFTKHDANFVKSVATILGTAIERKEHERELARNETLFKESKDVNAVLDTDGTFQHLTPSVASVLGHEPDELVGENAFDYIHPEDREAMMAKYGRMLEKPDYEPTVEFRFEHGDGSWVVLEARARNLLDDPLIEGIVAYTRDVTERKEREHELELYETIVETVDDGVYALDDEDRFVLVNESYCGLTGYDRDELLGERAPLVHDEETNESAAGLSESVVDGERDDAVMEATLTRADGGTVPVETRFGPCRYDEASYGRCGVSRDISERLERERKLARFRRAVEASGNPIFMTDTDGRITYVNSAFEEMADVSASAVLGETPGALRPGERDGGHQRDLWETVLAGEVWEGEITDRRRSGERYHAELTVAPVTDEDAEVDRLVAVQTDITERVERERELERQRERLAALNHLNAVVHEITEAVVEQSTREEIEEIVCEQLAATDSYEFAWVAEVDPTTDAIQPRVEAGVDGYLDEIPLSIDPDDPAGQGPTGRAVRTQEMQVVRDALAEEDFAPWQEYAREYGYRASAAIPVQYEGTLYGILAVYTDRPDAFAAQEQEVISQLGEVVGHAIAAVERKRALMSDEVVELQFAVRDVFAELDVDVVTDDRIALEEAVPVGDDEYLIYGTTTEDGMAAVEALIEALPHWSSVSVVGEEGNRKRFELHMTEPPVLSVFAAHGGDVQTAVIEDGNYHMAIQFPPGVDVRRITDAVKSEYPSAELRAQRHAERAERGTHPVESAYEEALTDRQRTVLETAHYRGYFEWPRESSGEDIAETLEITPATLSQHLRAAERKLVGALVEGHDWNAAAT